MRSVPKGTENATIDLAKQQPKFRHHHLGSFHEPCKYGNCSEKEKRHCSQALLSRDRLF